MWASCVLTDAVSLVAHAQAEAPTVALVREALEQARFEQAEQRAVALLSRNDVSARDRNDTLELLAIVQIAQRNTPEAGKTLKLLFDRDGEHPRRVVDPGPTVDGAFARARRAPHEPVSVALRGSPRRDAYGREWLDLEIVGGARAVDALHVFARAGRDAAFTEVVQYPSVDDRATALLPAAPLGAERFQWYVEARAPSGLLLARLSSPSAPQESELGPRAAASLKECPVVHREPPLIQRWWVWTTAGLVIAGAMVSGAVAAR